MAGRALAKDEGLVKGEVPQGRSLGGQHGGTDVVNPHVLGKKGKEHGVDQDPAGPNGEESEQ
jgi:hypothetical protein